MRTRILALMAVFEMTILVLVLVFWGYKFMVVGAFLFLWQNLRDIQR